MRIYLFFLGGAFHGETLYRRRSEIWIQVIKGKQVRILYHLPNLYNFAVQILGYIVEGAVPDDHRREKEYPGYRSVQPDAP